MIAHKLQTTTQEPETETTTTIDTQYVVVDDTELEKPYRVIIQNDDVTRWNLL
ncbi:MAG: hypothetical protein HC893_12685 [Chloroflexaceae bacterium]|nr:hypothetical protein [Chloroflexaceae bacterium]